MSAQQLIRKHVKCGGSEQQDSCQKEKKNIQLVYPSVVSICPCSHCFLLLSAAGCESLSEEQKEVLLWLFHPPLQAEPLSEKPNLTEGNGEKLVEIGPRYCCVTCPVTLLLPYIRLCVPNYTEAIFKTLSETHIKIYMIKKIISRLLFPTSIVTRRK